MKDIKKVVQLILLAILGFQAEAKSAKSAAVVETRKLSSGEMAAAGAFATAFGVTIMHPVDTVKTLQQSTEGMGLNMLQATRKITTDGGIGALYSGLGPYVTSDGCAGALKFATYEALKNWMKDKVPEEHYGKGLFVVAAAAFLVSSIALVPGELLKQRLQMGQISSIRQGIPLIFKNEGILGFYSGYSGVCLRDIPYTMMELGIYDNLKSMILKFKNRDVPEGAPQKPGNQLDEILAAAISGGITGFLTAPFDNVKTKLMVDTGMYNGFFDCVAKSVKENGIGSMFSGSAARVAWLMPFTAIYLPVYEIIKRRLEMMPMKPSAATAMLAMKGGHQKKIAMSPIVRRGPSKKSVQSLKYKHSRYASSVSF